MTAGLVTSSVAPVLAEPSLRSEQVTQLLLGEGALVLGEQGDMLKVHTSFDGYEGWVHRGYIGLVDLNRHDTWLQTAAWSLGASVTIGSQQLVVPHRGRVGQEGRDRVRLADGRAAKITAGSVLPLVALIELAQATSPVEWAWREFAETPYLWGGLTRGGIDCSGLVQQTFAARGVPLPRDAREQTRIGSEVALDQIGPSDLLFFRGQETERVTHVAFADSDEMIVHATVATGRVCRERWDEGHRAAALRPLLVAARRLT